MGLDKISLASCQTDSPKPCSGKKIFMQPTTDGCQKTDHAGLCQIMSPQNYLHWIILRAVSIVEDVSWCCKREPAPIFLKIFHFFFAEGFIRCKNNNITMCQGNPWRNSPHSEPNSYPFTVELKTKKKSTFWPSNFSQISARSHCIVFMKQFFICSFFKRVDTRLMVHLGWSKGFGIFFT